MTKQQRRALEIAIAELIAARLGVKGQHTEVSKLKARLTLDAKRRQLELLLDALTFDESAV